MKQPIHNSTANIPVLGELKIVKTDPAELVEWRRRYLASVEAPLDGMWLHFASLSEHFALLEDGAFCGYCSVNSDRKMLQFFIDTDQQPSNCFVRAINDLKITGVVVPTCDPQTLSLCQLHSELPPIELDLMYHVDAKSSIEQANLPEGSSVKPIELDQLDKVVDFSFAAIGADKNWLSKYYREHIDRGEIFGLWQSDQLMAIGEYRPSDLQTDIVDVGMIVGKEFRGRGIATNLLRWLIHRSGELEHQAICSTEKGNIAAQNAINRAGFTQSNQILEYRFEDFVNKP